MAAPSIPTTPARNVTSLKLISIIVVVVMDSLLIPGEMSTWKAACGNSRNCYS